MVLAQVLVEGAHLAIPLLLALGVADHSGGGVEYIKPGGGVLFPAFHGRVLLGGAAGEKAEAQPKAEKGGGDAFCHVQNSFVRESEKRAGHEAQPFFDAGVIRVRNLLTQQRG